ncbi:tetratricopeptide repeat protein [Epibacterium ulvae]|uniref:tetratricopeptide repeat protein n=1 Tax=Epibacterium ulvae TaxID=1156985 RepID=UPI0024931B0C|nr:hypothetical protein [Epibacterium ulvae]
MRSFAIATALVATFALPVFAAGGDDFAPPKPSDGTKKCWGKRVYDAETGKCIKPEKSSMNDQQLLQTARELAYLDRQEDAQAVLAAISDQTDGHVLTYWGFTHRKLGNQDLADRFYTLAIAQDPSNILARSYMAQGFVTQGKLGEAYEQWQEILAYGGKGSWPETSLRKALETGKTYSY